MPDAHLHLHEEKAHLGQRAAALELPGTKPQRLAYTRHDGPLNTAGGGNAFVLAFFLGLMRTGRNLVVHGPVSERLLMNLEELQDAWHKWRPQEYQRFDVRPEHLLPERDVGARRAITAFSGGVDAAFSVYQHLRGDRLHYGRVDLQTALLVQGFDIPDDQPELFKRARERARRMLEGSGLGLISLSTDFRRLQQRWEDCFGLAVAAALMLFEEEYDIGVIGSSEDYGALVLPWGSNPVTDRLCSSGLMEIRHEGAGYSRSEKVEALLSWPELVEQLRVCWAGEQMDRNCGTCEKCVRTLLNFRLYTSDTPACFPSGLTIPLIRGLRVRNEAQRQELRSILSKAEELAIDEPWVSPLRTAIRGKPGDRLRRTLQRYPAAHRLAVRGKRALNGG